MKTFDEFVDSWNNSSGQRYVWFRKDGFIVADNFIPIIASHFVLIILQLVGNTVAVIDLKSVTEVH